jgi:hypothetical protein
LNFVRRLLLFILIIWIVLFNAQRSHAQSEIELENVGASYQFGEHITFVATIKASAPIQSASILISDESQGITHLEPLTLQSDGHIEYRLDTRQTLLPPFTHVKWSYQFTLSDGNTIQSQTFTMRYADNRFQWQTLSSDPLQVNWYSGDGSFGQAALEAAQSGLESIRKLMPLDLTQPIEIFIYGNTADLRETLFLGGENWVAGHADPALGVLMVTIEPGTDQSIQMEQRIPHELMHVMLYRRVGAGYARIPAWLREGTGTLAEVYPNADYDSVLADAAASNDLIPLQDLCDSFPAEAGPAFLAYAESRSFTNYLHDAYGSTGLLNLALSYADGVDCEQGTERVFGVPLSNLELKWRSSVLGQNAFLSVLQSNSSYLALLCLVLVIPFVGILMTLRRKGSRDEPKTYDRK